MALLPFYISFQGTTWPQHRYDISITHQQQFLQQQHDNLYNNSSTRITATASVGSNFKTIRFCATHKHKANQRQQQQQQQQQQHYASQHSTKQQRKLYQHGEATKDYAAAASTTPAVGILTDMQKFARSIFPLVIIFNLLPLFYAGEYFLYTRFVAKYLTST